MCMIDTHFIQVIRLINLVLTQLPVPLLILFKKYFLGQIKIPRSRKYHKHMAETGRIYYSNSRFLVVAK